MSDASEKLTGMIHYLKSIKSALDLLNRLISVASHSVHAISTPEEMHSKPW